MRWLAFVFCLFGQTATAETCVKLGGTAHVLMLGGAYEIVEREDGATILIEPNGRSPRMIVLNRADGVELGDDGVVLKNGLKLDYDTSTEEAAGSGGAVAGLVGLLGSDPPLAVTCSMQSEIPDAEWCLPILGQLRSEADGCTEEE
jgi:hypothetical protein